MTPLYDQDGNQRDRLDMRLTEPVTVVRVMVEHSAVRFFDADGEPVFVVERPTHPGAGLSLDTPDWVESMCELWAGRDAS